MEKYKDDPPKISLEGRHAKDMLKHCQPGDCVEMTVKARVSSATAHDKPPKWGPQHTMGMEIMSMKPTKAGLHPTSAKNVAAAPAKNVAAAVKKPAPAPGKKLR